MWEQSAQRSLLGIYVGIDPCAIQSFLSFTRGNRSNSAQRGIPTLTLLRLRGAERPLSPILIPRLSPGPRCGTLSTPSAVHGTPAWWAGGRCIPRVVGSAYTRKGVYPPCTPWYIHHPVHPGTYTPVHPGPHTPYAHPGLYIPYAHPGLYTTRGGIPGGVYTRRGVYQENLGGL